MTDAALVKQEVSPLVIFQQMQQAGATIETLNAFMALQERYEANEAKREVINDERKFNEAMVAFHLDPPKIWKDNHVSYVRKDGGKVEYDHATLGNVVELVTQGLAKVGVSHEWIPSQDGGKIAITCRLKLGMFHKDTTLSSSADPSGGKNDIQAISSAVSYLERYTLLSATGMATHDQDDDGRKSEQDQAVAERLKLIKASATLEELQQLYTEAYKLAEAAKDQAAARAYIEAKDLRHGEIVAEVRKAWAGQARDITTLEEFNANIVPLMKERSGEFRTWWAGEAKARGWKADKSSGLFVEAAK